MMEDKNKVILNHEKEITKMRSNMEKCLENIAPMKHIGLGMKVITMRMG